MMWCHRCGSNQHPSPQNWWISLNEKIVVRRIALTQSFQTIKHNTFIWVTFKSTNEMPLIEFLLIIIHAIHLRSTFSSTAKKKNREKRIHTVIPREILWLKWILPEKYISEQSKASFIFFDEKSRCIWVSFILLCSQLLTFLPLCDFHSILCTL